MKNIFSHATFFIVAAGLLATMTACNKDDGFNNGNNNSDLNLTNLQAQLNGLPKESLSTVELNSLVFMREEEKLARDVYTYAYQKWSVKIFSNIAGSEQTHMDAVLMLLNKYNITDPAASLAPGVFSNATLQNLYNALAARTGISLSDAYQVGATIEDLDIFDLLNARAATDNQDIGIVYDMLTKGSRNHLRSFYKNIISRGDTYTPQFITQEQFDAIINSGMETGF